MEKSSLDYREKLYSQIQEEYGKLVYTYTCHFKMADRLSKRNFWIKWGQIGLSAISTGGFLGVLISNEQILLWAGGLYLNDVAGVRIVCAFIDDIYMISDLITQQDDIKVIEVKDYIKNPKPNGYRSYHMIVEIPVFFAKGKTPMRVELQIRTNGMDFWATLEHQLRYKKGIEEMPGYEEISEELLHSARAIIDADNEMQRIKDKIGMFHEI